MNDQDKSKDQLILELQELQKKYDSLKEISNKFHSERMQNDDALLEAKWKFRALFEKGPIGVAYHVMVNDAFGKPKDYFFLDANDAYRELIGVDPRGKLATEVFPSIKNDPFDSIGKFGKVANTGKTISFEQYMQPNQRWYNCVAYQYKPDYFVTAFIEITEHKQIEQSLKVSEEKFRNLVETTNDIIWETNLEDLYTYVNPRVEKILGYKPEEIIGHSPFDFMTLDEAKKIKKRSDQIIASKKPFEGLINNNIHKDGHQVILETSGVPIFDSNNKLLGYRGIDRDITERKQAEKELRDSELKYRSLIENTNDVVFCVDKKGEYKFTNRVFAQTFGKTPDYFIGKTFWDIYPKEEADHRFGAVKEMFRTGEVQTIEVKVPLPDRTLYYLAKANPIKDETGKVIFNLTTAIDITERKLHEEKIKENNSWLELAMQSANMAWWKMDIETGNVIFEKRKAEMLGYSSEKFNHYKDFMALVHVDDIEKAMNAMRLHIEGKKEKYEVEYRILNHLGEYQWFYDIGSIVKRNKDDKPLKVTGLVIDICERKHAEETLRKSEERYSKLLENLEAGIVVHAPDTSITLNNHRAAELLGLSDDQMKGKKAIDPAWRFVDENHNALPNGHYPVNRIVNSKQPFRNQILGVRQHDKNDVVWLLVNGLPILNNQGEITEILISFIDITERKSILEVHEFLLTCGHLGSVDNYFESLAKFLSVHLNMEYVCIDRLEGDGLTATTLAIYNSGEYETNVSYALKETPCGDVVGKTICCFPENVCNLFPYDQALQDLNAVCYIGTTLWSYDGKPIGLIALIGQKPLKNVTHAEAVLKQVAVRTAGELERKQAEIAVQESKDFLDKIINSLASPIFVKDDKHRFCLVNNALCTLLNLSPEELIDSTGLEHFPDDQNEVFLAKDKEVLETGKETISEEFITDGTGKIRTIITSKTSYTDTSGNNYLVGIINDITNRKQIELELLKAKVKAEESDKLKSAFLANMSHEIRTPMNGILGFAELLKEPKLSGEEQLEYINIIEKSGARMLNIINDIVSISKIESGTMEIFEFETNINKQTEYIYNLLKRDAEKKKLSFVFKNGLTDIESMIKTDNMKFISILSNLVKNAIKYTYQGSIEFGYILKHNSNSLVLETKELEFYIKDTGIGIPKDRQDAIFERFIQADVVDKMARQGVGLGLAISKAYATMLGGRIWVESIEGKGSTFYFTIPYNVEPPQKTININDVSDDMETNVNKLKILIVEDDEISEMLISISIKEFSKEILKVKTGAEAVSTCRNNLDIDLILMDIQMNDLNGYEATRQIRQFNKEVVIIAQTAFGLSGDKEKAIEAGCNDYISKPIKKEELHSLILKYFNN